MKVGKRKMLVVRKDQRRVSERARVGVREMEEVDQFKYLEVMISKVRGLGGGEPNNRLMEGRKMWGTLGRIRKGNWISRSKKGVMRKGVYINSITRGH